MSEKSPIDAILTVHTARLECDGCSHTIEEEGDADLTEVSSVVERLAERALSEGWAYIDDGSNLYWGCARCKAQRWKSEPSPIIRRGPQRT